jgi:hypothetical protein
MACVVLKLGRFRQQIRNTWKVLKCGTGEGWRRSVGLNMREMKKWYFSTSVRVNVRLQVYCRCGNSNLNVES